MGQTVAAEHAGFGLIAWQLDQQQVVLWLSSGRLIDRGMPAGRCLHCSALCAAQHALCIWELQSPLAGCGRPAAEQLARRDCRASSGGSMHLIHPCMLFAERAADSPLQALC